jgi:hypothetical protein
MFPSMKRPYTVDGNVGENMDEYTKKHLL